ncbi:MAG: FAD-binding oxidoreductase [Rhodobacteraceae bacterium]|nr:MAG: FAD-binding oxidoreductase [Paracoccaceae bacterium]
MTADIAGCKAALAHLDLDDNPATVRQKSRDFFWYSPPLKARMDHLTADFVVAPKSEAEVVAALAAAYAHDVPVTTRGAGTGNYGQAMPLSGGMILHTKAMTAVKEIGPGRVRVEAGAIIADVDRETRAQSGQELRLHPSTYHTASIGGFIAGGSGGVGSIRWGGLRDAGNILKLRLVTMEAEPRVIELTGDAIHKASHAYGVNGIITEVEMPLAPAYEWIDLLVGFDAWEDANRYASDMAHQDGLLLKELATVAAPAPHAYFLRHKPFIPEGAHVAIATVADHALDAALAVTARHKAARVLFRSDRDWTEGLPPGFELAWNHTTLRALRVDPKITYLQVLYAGDPVAKLSEMQRLFGDEVPGHAEWVRFNGAVVAMGLPLVRYTTEARLEEIMALHEAHGCPIFNPHRYTLEEGGMKQSDPVQLAFKRETDPKGLLNPGKMIAWDDPDYDFDKGGFYLFPGMTAVE